MPLSLAAQLVPSAIQLGTGVIQGIQGRRMARDIVDPLMEIPGSATQALGNAQTLAQQKYMAGYGDLQNELDLETAAATGDVMQGATSGAEALAAITGINRNNQRTQTQIGFANARDKMGRQADYRGELGNMANWEQLKWKKNVEDKFLRDAAAASALRNAGMHNTYQGVKGMANPAALYFGNKSATGDTGQVPQGGVSSTYNPNFNGQSFNGQNFNPDAWSSMMQFIPQFAPGATTNPMTQPPLEQNPYINP